MKSWEKMQTLRPSIVPKPVITPSVYGRLSSVEPGRPGAGQHVELLEGTLVQEVVDPLPGGHLALGVLALDRVRGAGVEGGLLAAGQLFQAFGHGML